MINNLENKECIINNITNVHLRYKKNMNQKLKKYNLTFEQSQILELLFENKSMTQSEICKKTSSDASNITMILKRMIENGFVKKSKSEKDKRVTLISPSEKADDLKEILSTINNHDLCCSLNNITLEEYKIAIKVIKEINRELVLEEFKHLI